jgi:hypothetical protein
MTIRPKQTYDSGQRALNDKAHRHARLLSASGFSMGVTPSFEPLRRSWKLVSMLRAKDFNRGVNQSLCVRLFKKASHAFQCVGSRPENTFVKCFAPLFTHRYRSE